MNNEKIKRIALLLAIVFSGLSLIAVLIAFAISGKPEQLYKATLPLLLVVLNIALYRKIFPKK